MVFLPGTYDILLVFISENLGVSFSLIENIDQDHPRGSVPIGMSMIRLFVAFYELAVFLILSKYL